MKMLLRLFAAAIIATAASAQDEKPASIGGMLRDASSGAPIAGATVQLTTGIAMRNNVRVESRNVKSQETTSDSEGHYRFSNVPAGEGSLTVTMDRRPVIRSRVVRLTGGQELNYDVSVRLPGSISGKVLDDNGDPVPGVSVQLVVREYHAGKLRTLVRGITRANDEGEYTLALVDAGRPYLLYVVARSMTLPAISPVPLDPKMRRAAYASTFYPNSRDLAGAAPIVLRAGEHREAVNVKMAKSTGFCVEATAGVLGVPGPLHFEITAQEPSFGAGANGGLYAMQPGGNAGKDGKIRICGLTPGAYLLEVMDRASPPPFAMGETTFAIADRDVTGVEVQALSSQPIPGEVVLEGEAPPEPIAGTVSVSLNSMHRAVYPGQQTNARPSVPATFQLAYVPEGDYFFFPPSAPDGYYVKDILYNGQSVLHGTVTVGRAMSPHGLRVVVGKGPGKIEAAVTASENKPALEANVIALPAGLPGEAEAAAALVRCSTDQDGKCTLSRLAPGRYQVFAVTDDIDMTPEFMAALMQARTTRGQQVDVTENGSASIQLKQITLR